MPTWGFEVGLNMASWFRPQQIQKVLWREKKAGFCHTVIQDNQNSCQHFAKGECNTFIQANNVTCTLGKRNPKQSFKNTENINKSLCSSRNYNQIANGIPVPIQPSPHSNNISNENWPNSLANLKQSNSSISLDIWPNKNDKRLIDGSAFSDNKQILEECTRYYSKGFQEPHNAVEEDPLFRSNSCIRFLFRLIFHFCLASLTILSVAQDRTALSLLIRGGFAYNQLAMMMWTIGSICLLCQFLIFICSFALYATIPPIYVWNENSTRLRYKWLHRLAIISSATLLLSSLCCHGCVAFSFLAVIVFPNEKSTGTITSASAVSFDVVPTLLRPITDSLQTLFSHASVTSDQPDWENSEPLSALLLASHSGYSITLTLIVVDCTVSWFQAWIVYFWSKPCCYWAEPAIPQQEKAIYDGLTGHLNCVQIITLPLLSAWIFSCGVYTLFYSTTGHYVGTTATPDHLISLPFVVAMWCSALTTIPIALCLLGVPLYLIVRLAWSRIRPPRQQSYSIGITYYNKKALLSELMCSQ